VPTTLEAGYKNSDYTFWTGALGGRLTDARITDADVPALPSGVSGIA
jgi:hypothetical protein